MTAPTRQADAGCECWACRPDLMITEYRRLGHDIPLAEADRILAAFERLHNEIAQLTAAAEVVSNHIIALIGESDVTCHRTADRLSFQSGRFMHAFLSQRRDHDQLRAELGLVRASASAKGNDQADRVQCTTSTQLDTAEACTSCNHRSDHHTLDGGRCLVAHGDPLTEQDFCQCDEYEDAHE